MGDRHLPDADEINRLFANGDAREVWGKAEDVVRRISPDYDFELVRSAYDDVDALFCGEYPGYAPVKTLYHDQAHTLHVFMCAVRLMHGVHVSEMSLRDDEVTLVMLAALMHDIGYAQTLEEAAGTGAQYTQCHIARGIGFMQHYLATKSVSSGMIASLELLIRSTDPGFPFGNIPFADDRGRKLGCLVATADLVGQMADRAYLEKLLFLFLEFKEAHFGNYQNVHDMLRQTGRFYVLTREKLDGVYQGMYGRLVDHFRETLGVERNYYVESIEKNIDYLTYVIQLEEEKYLSMLKRGGIVDKAKAIPDFKA